LSPHNSVIEYETSAGRNLIPEILTLLQEKLAIRVESADTDLFHSGAMDSAAQVHLLMHLEKRFGVSLPMEELEIDSFCTVARIAQMVAGSLQTMNREPEAPVREQRDLTAEIRQLLVEKLAIRVDPYQTDLFAAGVFDSMTLVQFIFHMEEHFGFHLPMEELDVDSFQSVESIARLVAANTRPEPERAQAC
jgi:acyl carrier protein